MDFLYTPVAIGAVAVFVLLFIIVMISRLYRTVEQGQALIINTPWGTKVSFSGGIVIPIVYRAEYMDISVKSIEVDRQGLNGLICADNIRADIKVAFFVRINKTTEDVLRVASSVGVSRASDRKTIEDLFQAKFSEALKSVGKKMNFIDLYNTRDIFKDQIVQVIGRDLNGYSLEDAAIDYLEQTPLELLNPDNILDAEGRKKIIELTTTQRIKANEIQREGEKVIKKQDVETREAILSLERQQAEAEARQHREIATVQARETAEQAKVEAEGRQKSEQARISTEQELGVQKQQAQREVEIAGKNREGAVMVENERIQKERDLEATARHRAVALVEIEMEKAVAIERKNIAEVIRERVAVERTVAEEEERIKDVRVISEAKRVKEVAVQGAQQHAEEGRIREVTAAQSAETAAGHAAKEKMILAEAEQGAAERQAVAAIRRAEGKQAEAAADGLARVKVREADAEAIRKIGFAEVEVKQANAKAVRELGMAEVDVRKAGVTVVREQGAAEASAIEAKMLAEAKGLTEKLESMGHLSPEARGHEEFRIKLERDVEVAKAQITADVAIAGERAKLLAEPLKNAKFEIVGGDGEFFERFVKALSLGKGIDATISKSTLLQSATQDYLTGERSLPDDLKALAAGLGADGLRDLSLADLARKLGKDPATLAGLLKRG